MTQRRLQSSNISPSLCGYWRRNKLMNYIRKSPDGHSHQRNDIRNRCLISGFPTKYLILSSHRSIVLLPENTWLKPSIHRTDGALFSSNKEGNSIILTTQQNQIIRHLPYDLRSGSHKKKTTLFNLQKPSRVVVARDEEVEAGETLVKGCRVSANLNKLQRTSVQQDVCTYVSWFEAWY